MSDDRFKQTTLRAPRVDQDQAIATYQSGTHLLNYAYPAQHSGVATIDALLPDYNGFSTWNTAGAGTLIPYSFMNATLHYLDSASYAKTSSQPAYSTTSSIGETGQIYVLERLSLGPEKRLSTWASETYDAEITLDHVLIDANGTIYGKPTPNPAAILEFTADGMATGYLVYGNDAYALESGNVALSLNTAQRGTLTLDRFNVTPLGAGQPDLGDLTIDVSNIAYLGACGSADFCSNAAHYAFTSTGSIPDGTTATGRVLGGIFGPNGENAGALLDASNADTVEFRGDFVARRNP